MLTLTARLMASTHSGRLSRLSSLCECTGFPTAGKEALPPPLLPPPPAPPEDATSLPLPNRELLKMAERSDGLREEVLKGRQLPSTMSVLNLFTTQNSTWQGSGQEKYQVWECTAEFQSITVPPPPPGRGRICIPVQTPWERMTEVSSLDWLGPPIVLTSDGFTGNSNRRSSGNLT